MNIFLDGVQKRINAEKNKAVQKGQKGFKAGLSGNPAGRPKGSRNKTTLAMESLLEGAAEKITRKCIEKALDGDNLALRICMDRIISVKKSRPVNFEFAIPENPEELSSSINQIISAGAKGEISPDEAKIFADLIEIKCRVIETVELAARLEILEKNLGDSK